MKQESVNEYNSDRLEFLRKSDHYLYEQDELKICKHCGELYLDHGVYYMDWGNPSELSRQSIRANNGGIGGTPFTHHVLRCQPQLLNKIVNGLGLK